MIRLVSAYICTTTRGTSQGRRESKAIMSKTRIHPDDHGLINGGCLPEPDCHVEAMQDGDDRAGSHEDMASN